MMWILTAQNYFFMQLPTMYVLCTIFLSVNIRSKPHTQKNGQKSCRVNLIKMVVCKLWQQSVQNSVDSKFIFKIPKVWVICAD